MSLDVHSICVDVDNRRILGPVSFHVPTGTTTAVVGPSGVGKSTLLRVIAGVMQPTSGSVSIDGADVTGVPPHKRSVGMVFQDDQLFPHLSVARNISFGLEMLRPSKSRLIDRIMSGRRMSKEHSRRVNDLLVLVGLEDFAHRRPMSLSGGEAKRVALARALAPSPSIILLDEPLTGLDRDLHDRLMSDLRRILETTRTTAVLVTHDASEAEHLAHNIVRLEPRQRG